MLEKYTALRLWESLRREIATVELALRKVFGVGQPLRMWSSLFIGYTVKLSDRSNPRK